MLGRRLTHSYWRSTLVMMRVARTSFVVVLAIALGASAIQCEALTPMQATQCCRSMKCARHGNQATDCCKQMSQTRPVLGLPALAAHRPLTMVAIGPARASNCRGLLNTASTMSAPNDHAPPPALSPPLLSLRI